MLNLRLARPMLIALAACAANFLAQGSALADDAQENKALKEQMRQMMQRMDALQKQVEALSRQQAATPPPAVVTVPPPVTCRRRRWSQPRPWSNTKKRNRCCTRS